jgi:hypothetical protein
MTPTGLMLKLVEASRRDDDWRRADEWRRLHGRPDALPPPAVGPARRFSLAGIQRLILRRA